jgi:hypothetical protein
MRTAEPGHMRGLWDAWPALAGALAALDLELNTPVSGQGDLPGLAVGWVAARGTGLAARSDPTIGVSGACSPAHL